MSWSLSTFISPYHAQPIFDVSLNSISPLSDTSVSYTSVTLKLESILNEEIQFDRIKF